MRIKKIDNTNGTCLQGYRKTTFSLLNKVFGKPNYYGGAGDKVDVEWGLKIEGIIVTIYNWKNGKCYLGDEGKEIEQIENWHIGGRGYDSVMMVEDAIDDYFKKPKRTV